MKVLNIFVLLGGIILTSCDGYKILALFPMPSGSHYNLNSVIVNELAARGHEVTHLTAFPQKNPPTNLKEIRCRSDTLEGKKRVLFGLDQESVYGLAQFMIDVGYVVTEDILKSEEIQKILQSKEKYDVVLTPGQYVNEGLSAIAHHHLQAPHVMLSTMPLFPWTNFQLAYPTPPSYVPTLLSRYSGHMNFWQRLMNSFYDLTTIMYHQWIILPRYRDMVKKYIPGQPDLYDFLNNASLVLLNSHMSIYDARPQVPNAVEIGGFHITEPKKLPEDLQEFLDNAVEGVIIFSMGSNLKSKDIPPKALNGMLKAFSKLKQKVLCKWETDQLTGQPPNVKLMKWLPQSDVIAHPNVKVLICHGGLLSLEESIYYGIPVIGIPIFVDQKMNMATATSKGYAVQVNFQELGDETLSKALDLVLKDPKYKNNAQRFSKIMRDRPMKPLDSAIYWIEYVARHQGATHLRYPGADLAWYQRNLLDVIAFVLIVIFLSILIISKILKRIFGLPRPVQDKTKKNN